jgi:predicted enzyme related to lactoylglutathione lyase
MTSGVVGSSLTCLKPIWAATLLNPPKGAPSGTNAISFYCDDIETTVAEFKSRGVEFTGPVIDQGYGLVTHFRVPGGFEIQLYQPRYSKGPENVT